MSEFELTLEQIADFDDDGFFIVDGLLDREETDLLRDIARADQALVAGAASRADGEGGCGEGPRRQRTGRERYL